MGEIKPLGSEKLTGNEKMQRILELAYYQDPNSKTKKTNNKHELIEETSSGVYAIDKEKDGYFVKKGINESSLDYIGGLFMKNKNRFSSYADALKRLEFLKGQEMLSEATKYVLKRPTPAAPEMEAPVAQSPIPTPSQEPLPEPAPTDPTAAPAPDSTGEETPSGDNPEGDDFGADVEPDTLKAIQKLTGKLGQKLREYDEEIKSDDIKYVLNMVLSAVDLEKLEDSDKEEILDKLDGDDEEGNYMNQEDGEVPPSPEEELPTQQPEDELGEISTSLEEFTNSELDFGEDDDEDSGIYQIDRYPEENDFDQYDELEINMDEDTDTETDNDLDEFIRSLESNDNYEENNEQPRHRPLITPKHNNLDSEIDEDSVYQNDINDYESTWDNGGGDDELDEILRSLSEDDDYMDDELSLNEIKSLIRKNFIK